MLRIRISLPGRASVAYRNLDMLHDALVNAWIESGATPSQVLGPNADIWHFGVLGWHRAAENRVHTLVVGTPTTTLADCLKKMDPASVKHARASTGEVVDFTGAKFIDDPDPIAPGQNVIGSVMLSPLAISRRSETANRRRWHTDMNTTNLSAAVSSRLSRLTGRTVALQITPDHLYLRANPKHDTLVQMKEMNKHRRSFVIGMRAPLVIQGSEEDLRLVWYAGIGEKNRNGFGCIGLAERGIRR